MRSRTTTELFSNMPHFPWRRPVRLIHAGVVFYACRICWGIHDGCHLAGRYDTPAEVLDHIAREHPDAPGAR